jgi:hypothetical protein
MNKKQVTEWASRILWLLGALFALTACVCLMIAFAKTEVMKGKVIYYGVYPNGVGSNELINHSGYVFLELPSNLYRAVGYDTICAFFCFLVAKVLHWFSTKGE